MGLRRALLESLPHTDWGNRKYWRWRFRRSHGRWPNAQNPERFTDHLYRIKTDGRLADPLYGYCTDKEHAKDWIAGMLGPDFTPETYAVLRSDADVDGFTPPVPCVIKPTHASGPVIFHRDPAEPLDRSRIKSWLCLDYYRSGRELNYRGLVPKVIAEAFFSDGSGEFPTDYKVFCFGGTPRLVQRISGRGRDRPTVENWYDADWNPIDCTLTYPKGDGAERPPLLRDMLDVAARLSEPFPFIRVDLYASATAIRVGELTPCPTGAGDPFHPESADYELGRLFILHA